jgi:uncharacterized membrane protein required for colicin V production
MILELILGFIVIAAAASGYRVGFLRAIVRLVTWVIVWYVAIKLAKPVAAVIQPYLPDLTAQFVRSGVPDAAVNQAGDFLIAGLAFTLIMIIGQLLARAILRQLRWIKKVPILGFVDALGGLAVYVVITIIVLFFTVQILSVIPNPWLQDQFLEANYLNDLMDRLPFFAEQIYQWWL